MEITLKMKTGNKVLDENNQEIDERLNKTFKSPFLNGYMFRKTMEMSNLTNEGQDGAKVSDDMVDYIVEIFGNKFTREEFYEGIEGNKILDTFTKCINEVMGKTVDKANEIAFLNQKNS